MNVLYIYSRTATYTNAVFDYLNAFTSSGKNSWFFLGCDGSGALGVNLDEFDAVCIHYSVRVAYNEFSEEAAEAIAAYRGLKAIFLQDEYENTRNTSDWIRRLKVVLVFTVVPEAGVAAIYPPAEFPNVRFVSCLTGYAPAPLPHIDRQVLPSRRRIVVGYRGRPLPLKYGELGREKVGIGVMVRRYCEESGIPCDIRWDEEGRIYGDAWPAFVGSCRAMLATESGSNVFDWDGKLEDDISEYRKVNLNATDDDIHSALISSIEQPGLMNQISPKVYEAIGARTALVLFEGRYSGVLTPWRHYIPLKKDGSNLSEVFAALVDGDLVDTMTDVAYSEIILSGRYSYKQFVERVDEEIAAALVQIGGVSAGPVAKFLPNLKNSRLSERPLRYQKYREGWGVRLIYIEKGGVGRWYPRSLVESWLRLPLSVRKQLKALLRKIRAS
jgi:hypothetical protein